MNFWGCIFFIILSIILLTILIGVFFYIKEFFSQTKEEIAKSLKKYALWTGGIIIILFTLYLIFIYSPKNFEKIIFGWPILFIIVSLLLLLYWICYGSYHISIKIFNTIYSKIRDLIHLIKSNISQILSILFITGLLLGLGYWALYTYNQQDYGEESKYENRYVYVTKYGYRYHYFKRCRSIINSESVTRVSLKRAKAEGYTECKICKENIIR